MTGHDVIHRIKKYARFSLSLLATVLVLSTSVSAASLSHTKPTQDRGIQQGCSSVCISHVQPAVVSDTNNKKEKEDKEPTPPLFTWIDSRYSILALYLISFVLFLVFIDRHRQFILTTNLRF